MGEGLVPPSKRQSKQQALLLGLASWGQGWPMLCPYSPLSASDQEEKPLPFSLPSPSSAVPECGCGHPVGLPGVGPAGVTKTSSFPDWAMTRQCQSVTDESLPANANYPLSVSVIAS